MKYDPEIHHRRSVRLPTYDYSMAGAYFITICTHNRELSLQAEQIRDVIRSAWHGLPARFPGAALDEFVVMPNHVHGIIMLTGAASGQGATRAGAASSATLGQVVRAFKSISAIEANRVLARSGAPFWQRNYYEHVIRDEEELNVVRRYIRDNPVDWLKEPDNPSNL